jgi:hypothetical protein
MDDAEFEASVKRLKAVNKVIEGVDPAIRADAFKLLQTYVLGKSSGGEDIDGAHNGRNGGPATQALDDESIQNLIDEHMSDVATENGILVTAIFYSMHGRGPFEVKELSGFAATHGVLFPDQFHKTVAKRKHDGNNIVRKVVGGYLITASGEAFLKQAYGVSRGTQPKPE